MTGEEGVSTKRKNFCPSWLIPSSEATLREKGYSRVGLDLGPGGGGGGIKPAGQGTGWASGRLALASLCASACDL